MNKECEDLECAYEFCTKKGRWVRFGSSMNVWEALVCEEHERLLN